MVDRMTDAMQSCPLVARAILDRMTCDNMVISADLRALLTRIEPLIDERCGVLAAVGPLEFPPGFAGQMHGFASCVARPTELHPLPSTADPELGALMGYGTALDQDTARVRAVCEGLERYCSVMYPLEGTRRARPRDLDGLVCDHARFPQCSARERERARQQVRLPDRTREDYWIRGFSLSASAPIWVPLTAVYLGLPIPLSEHVTWPVSTGFAAGSTYDQAVLSGLLEAIERDSLALWWLHQLPMPRIDPAFDGGDLRLRSLLERGRSIGLESHLFDLATDLGVPVVGVIQVDRHAQPHLITMGACRPSGLDAAVRVLEEAGSLRVAMARQSPLSRSAFMAMPARSPEEFGALYIDRDAITRFGFALDHPDVRTELSPGISGEPLDAVVSSLTARGMDVIVVDVTLPEVREVGVVVVKVIVPELMPISFCHDVRYLGHARLYEAPRRMGYGDRSESMITADPIPFA